MVIRDLEASLKPEPRVIALGFFDGVHLGHQSLLREMRNIAAMKKLIPTVFTFLDPPGRLFDSEHRFPGLLQMREDRLAALRHFGAEDIMAAPLSKEILDLPPERFLNWLFREKMDVRHAICGLNFTFGKKAEGDIQLLANFAKKEHIGLSIMEDCSYKEEIISSTRLREMVRRGEMEEANRLMATPFSHVEKVSQGKKLGRKLGFPTLNIALQADMVVPRFGVYASLVSWDNKICPAISNIGVRPTVEQTSLARSESFLYGKESPSYGDTIRVTYLRFIRPEENFHSAVRLQAQVLSDLERVRLDHEQHPEEYRPFQEYRQVHF